MSTNHDFVRGVGGSLPPGVVGQFRGYIEINLEHLNLLSSKPAHSTVIRLDWKKIAGKTTCVYQKSNSQDLSLKQRQVRYAIRCQIDSLNSYLQSHDVLSSKLLTNKSGLILGRGTIPNIDTLASNKIVKSSFLIVNDENENVAEVALVLKLMMKDSTSQNGTLNNIKPVRQVSFKNQVQIKKTLNKSDLLPSNISDNVQIKKALINKSDLLPSNISDNVQIKKALINKSDLLPSNISDNEISFNLTNCVINEEIPDKNASDQLLSTLQSKVLLLKTELSKLVYQNKLSQNLTNIHNEFKLPDSPIFTDSVLEENEIPHYNLNNIEQNTVDLLLSDNLSIKDKRLLSVFNEFISSDEDEEYLSEIDDPLHNDDILNQLFFSTEKIEDNTLKTRINSRKTNITIDNKVKHIAAYSSRLNTTKNLKFNQPKKDIRKMELQAERLNRREISLKANPILLHCMLSISSGFNFTPSIPRNLYLICKTFSIEHDCKSEIYWNCTNPIFNFQQIIPVKMNNDLLKKLKNNFMVIEVWEKKNLNIADELFGICKLPVHTFYLSFWEDEINKSLIKLKEPVVAVDGNVAIMNLSQTIKLGDLKVLLAMGTRSQIRYQQNTNDNINNKGIEKLDYKIDTSLCEYYVSHIFSLNSFVVHLQNPPGSLIWGESNCFVEYVFPKIIQHTQDEEVCLCYFKLKHRLCEPVIYFEDSLSHTIRLPNNVILRDTLKNIFANEGLPIYIYCRYYYPNEFDRLVAKTRLTVEELISVCSSTNKNFTLKLTSCKNPTAKIKYDDKGKFIGELKLKLSYEELQDAVASKGKIISDFNFKLTSNLPLKSVVKENKLANEMSTLVKLMITVERACNLPLISSFFNKIPPNACVSMSEARERITNIFPKSTEPVWNWRGTVPILLSKLQQKNQILLLNVWHVDDQENDCLLGIVSIDLTPLFLKSEHINTWYDIIDSHGLYQGKIKLQVKLANNDVASNPSLLSIEKCTATSSDVRKSNNSFLTIWPEQSSILADNIDNSPMGTRSFLLEKLNSDLEELSELQQNLKRCLNPELNFDKKTNGEVPDTQLTESKTSLSAEKKSKTKALPPTRIAAAIFK